MPKLRVGDKAPDFTLTATDHARFRLSDHFNGGPLVVTFYRGDFCPACNRYLHLLHEANGEFQQAGAQIVAISADAAEVGRQTVERHALSFPVLADPERLAVDAYDVIYNEAEGHAEPAVFVIDPDGTVAYQSITSGPLGRPAPADLLAIVRMSARH